MTSTPDLLYSEDSTSVYWTPRAWAILTRRTGTGRLVADVLGAREVAVLLAVAWMMDAGTMQQASLGATIEEVCAHLGCSLATSGRALRSLLKHGLLVMERNAPKGHHAGPGTKHYKISI